MKRLSKNYTGNYLKMSLFCLLEVISWMMVNQTCYAQSQEESTGVVKSGIADEYKEKSTTLTIREGVTFQQTFYPSGKLKTEVPIINQQKQGLFYCWRETGQLRYVVPFVEGKFNGTLLSFDINQRLEKQSDIKQGILDGYTCYFYPSGVMKSRAKYTNGQLEGAEHFSPNGMIVESSDSK